MKNQKPLVIVAIVCLLVGVSGGAAMAELDGCGDGVLYNETFDDGLRITGDEPCAIIGCTIAGDLRVINLPNVLLLNNTVGGIIRVDGNEGGDDNANVIANTVFGGRIVVRDLSVANVIENETLSKEDGNIRVINNISAVVQKNIASKNLICRENTDVLSFFNFAGNKLDCE